MQKILYFDNAATTAVYPEICARTAYYQSEAFWNASALYWQSRESVEAIRESRASIARVLGVSSDEVVFTSCATESNNWVLRSCCFRAGDELVTTEGEHASVRETAKALAERGVKVTFVPLTRAGTADPDALFRAITPRTKLVSLIHVSNETGAINDISALAAEIKEEFPDIAIHSDGVQAFGKVGASMKHIDFYSISGHKIHAPKGIGALYLKKGRKLKPLLTGGGQERGLRSGTENVAGIAAFGLSAEKFSKAYDVERMTCVRKRIAEKLSADPDFFANVSFDRTSPHILSCGFLGIRGETLMHALAERNIVIGTGSACSSHTAGNSVLKAIGISPERILHSVRISPDIGTTDEEVGAFCDGVLDAVRILKGSLR